MIRLAKYLVLIILFLLLSLATFASDRAYPDACKRHHIVVPSGATIITLSDLRDCVLMITLTAKRQRWWRIEATHDITTLHKDTCLWWNAHGNGQLGNTIQRQMKQVARSCTFRLNVIFRDGAKLQRWRVRIVDVKTIGD